MNHLRQFLTTIGFSVLLMPAVQAAPLLSTVQLVADTNVAADPVPPAQSFTITQTGSYTVTLTDLQTPAALTSLGVAIATPTDAALTLTSAGTKSVTLAAGTYTAQVLAVAGNGATGGTFSVQVTAAGAMTPTWQYEGAVGAASPAPSTGQSTLSTQFTVTNPGSYQLTVSDLAFPVALSSLQLIVLNHCGTTPGCVAAPVAPTPSIGPSISESIVLAAGTYDLFVVAAADTTALQGLYSIQISQGSSSVYAATVPVGELPAANPINLSASGSVTVRLADLASPAALASIQAVVTQNGNVLQQLSAAGSASFSAAAGALQVYVVAQAATSGQGAYEVYLTSGSQVLADIAQPVLAAGYFGYAYPVTLTNAGSYQASIYDFQVPEAFGMLSAIVAQAGSLLTATSGTSAFSAAAGPLTVLVFPTLTATGNNGLFGVQVAGQSSGVVAFETTQGVGAVFTSQSVTVSTAGNYNVTLTDLGFPAKFGNLVVIATQGNANAGELLGGGVLTLAAMPGVYTLNVLSQVGSTVDYGLYGLNVDLAPASPTVTLTASATSVASGQSATLTWSAMNATSCAATATPTSTAWAGTLPSISGMLSSGALTASTTFSITCTGAGGTSGAVTVQVAVDSASSGKSSGGGGAFNFRALLALGLLASWVLMRRRLAQAAGKPSIQHCP
jgi:hypothetical protein